MNAIHCASLLRFACSARTVCQLGTVIGGGDRHPVGVPPLSGVGFNVKDARQKRSFFQPGRQRTKRGGQSGKRGAPRTVEGLQKFSSK